MRPVTFGTGVLKAIFAAGPIATSVLMLFALFTERNGWRDIAAIPLFLILSIPVGMVFAVVPAITCTAALAWVGGRVPSARAYWLWAGAGAAVGAALGAVLGEGVEASAVLWLAMTGCLCALICRRGVRWPDEGLSYTDRTR